MKKVIWVFSVLIIIVLLLFFTVPTKQQYIKQMQKYVEQNDFVSYGTNEKLKDYGKTVVEKKLFQNTKYHNNLLYSTIQFDREDNKRQFGYGFLGKVFLNLKKEDFKKTEKQKMSESKTDTLKKVSEQFEIKSIETGFMANNLWHPSVKIEIQNITNNDIKDFIEVTAIFVNAKTGEQIGTKSSYISSKMKPFLSGLKKKKVLFPNIGFKGTITNLDITAKIYIEDELIDDVNINNVELEY